MIDLLDRRQPQCLLNLISASSAESGLRKIDVEPAHRPALQALGVPRLGVFLILAAETRQASR